MRPTSLDQLGVCYYFTSFGILGRFQVKCLVSCTTQCEINLGNRPLDPTHLLDAFTNETGVLLTSIWRNQSLKRVGIQWIRPSSEIKKNATNYWPIPVSNHL